MVPRIDSFLHIYWIFITQCFRIYTLQLYFLVYRACVYPKISFLCLYSTAVCPFIHLNIHAHVYVRVPRCFKVYILCVVLKRKFGNVARMMESLHASLQWCLRVVIFSHVWHDSSSCVACRIHIVWHDWCVAFILYDMSVAFILCDTLCDRSYSTSLQCCQLYFLQHHVVNHFNVWNDSSSRVVCHIRMYDMTHFMFLQYGLRCWQARSLTPISFVACRISNMNPSPFHDMTHLCVWHDSFSRVM